VQNTPSLRLDVIASLQWLFATSGLPRYIRSNNGPEFIADALKKWLNKMGCETIYIEPGSPWENPYIESFNGKLRDECLNMCVFKNVEEAQDVVECWRVEYNSQRPHSALGYTTSEKFANSAAALGQQETKPLPDTIRLSYNLDQKLGAGQLECRGKKLGIKILLLPYS